MGKDLSLSLSLSLSLTHTHTHARAHTEESYSDMEKNEILPFAAAQKH